MWKIKLFVQFRRNQGFNFRILLKVPNVFSRFLEKKLLAFCEANNSHKSALSEKTLPKVVKCLCGWNLWHSIVSFLPFFLTNGGESVLNIVVRAAHGRSAISSSIYFLLADYLDISASNKIGENFCWTWYFVRLTHNQERKIPMMDKLFHWSQHGL